MADIHMRSRADRRSPLREPSAPLESERRSGRVHDLVLRVERKSEKHVVVFLASEFVSPNYCLLEEELEKLLPVAQGRRIELEMSEVPYADSEALGRIIAWSRKFAQAGALLVVLNPMPYVSGVMDTLHLDAAVAIVSRHVTPPPTV
jgi:anti-anti-sigma regulatory factor